MQIHTAQGAPAESLLAGTRVLVGYGQDDPFRKIMDQLADPNDLKQAFVCVPLIGRRTKKIGVLVADNRFLESERTVDEESQAGLEAFAGLMAMTIENAQLRERRCT
jgi:GAF domain-containing protein